jgi:hypothetical protein
MSTVNLGQIKPVFKGAYNNSTAYVLDNIVTSGGSSYICILASQGNAVSNGTYWSQMSAAGTNGTNGSDGTDVGTVITTQGDVLYRDGSGLQRLAKGTAGQALVMNSGATAPEWGTGGVVLQIVSSSFSSNVSTSNTSATGLGAYTGFSVAITPKSSSSTILIQMTGQMQSTGSNSYGTINIGSSLNNYASGLLGTRNNNHHFGNGTGDPYTFVGATATHSHGTTSAFTYQAYFATHSAGTSILNSPSGIPFTIVLTEFEN